MLVADKCIFIKNATLFPKEKMQRCNFLKNCVSAKVNPIHTYEKKFYQVQKKKF